MLKRKTTIENEYILDPISALTSGITMVSNGHCLLGEAATLFLPQVLNYCSFPEIVT